MKAIGVAPGDLITVTYLKEGFTRQPFRVLKISPATNYRTATITAQIHDDAWYADTNGQCLSPSGATIQDTSGVGLPKPLLGSVVDVDGNVQFGVAETATANSDGSVETSILVSFVPPAVLAVGGPAVPLIDLSPTYGTGGTFQSGQVLYYAVSAADLAGNESTLSFLVTASIAADGCSVTLTGLSFASATTAFHVYRGSTPAQLLRIASDQPIACSFTDPGLVTELTPPADPNFDHANFYWRSEVQPEIGVTMHSATTIGNGTLQMALNAYRGLIARITRGTGAGQERSVAANDGTTLTVCRWNVEPDASSFFTVAEAGWHFAAVTDSSPVQFAIPNRAGEVVEVTGRAANVNNAECAPEVSTVTRWTIGGSGMADAQAPPEPLFGLGAGAGGGSIILSGVSFADLSNTNTISSGTLTLYYWNELLGTPSTLLAGDMADGDAALSLNVAGPGQAGTKLQIDGEILSISSVGSGKTEYAVTRGVDGSSAASHAAGTPVYPLANQTTIVPFPNGFFGSPYSGNWTYPIAVPDIRVGSAELFVTNPKGNSPTAGICVTHNADSGLRTLSGGQYSIQVDGYLAVEECVAPAVVIEAAHAVRDVFAILGAAADASVQVRVDLNGSVYCTLTFAPGTISSNSISGNTLPPLPAMGQLTVAILSVGQTVPGANLTVTIRL